MRIKALHYQLMLICRESSNKTRMHSRRWQDDLEKAHARKHPVANDADLYSGEVTFVEKISAKRPNA